ncbi:MAG: 50S ribosomal protein L30 [Sphingomonadales bacterium]|nr:50S ribosomal protein L30 [Sphingomonadales bacterium]MBM3913514.1 50S ribosomal protein L30 [Sphingomonadales bacterium]MBM3924201.1 50S ribosomal protein L30 [Sphingomonadales bacterium]
MATYQITQVKSAIGRSERQKRTLIALGLKKNQTTVRHEGTPQVLGMLAKVQHLIKIEEI